MAKNGKLDYEGELRGLQIELNRIAQWVQDNGKRVLVVDDVISTGGSLKALDALAEKTQCTIVGQAAVLAEGDASERKDIIFLEPLPLFFH